MTITFRPWNETRIAHVPISGSSALGNMSSRTGRRIIAAAKKTLPVFLAFLIFAAILVAIIAIRLAIWLPMHLRH
jgi:hypothetical protein